MDWKIKFDDKIPEDIKILNTNYEEIKNDIDNIPKEMQNLKLNCKSQSKGKLAYSSSKAAVLGLTKSLGKEYSITWVQH